MGQIEIKEIDYELAKFLKALGNPVRLSIIRKLIEKGRCPHGCDPCSCGDGCLGKDCKCGCKCGELVDMFTMSQSNISQHLKELKNAGVIENTSRKGDYRLDYVRIEDDLKKLFALFDKGYKVNPLFKENSDEGCNCGNMSRKYKPN